MCHSRSCTLVTVAAVDSLEKLVKAASDLEQLSPLRIDDGDGHVKVQGGFAHGIIRRRVASQIKQINFRAGSSGDILGDSLVEEIEVGLLVHFIANLKDAQGILGVGGLGSRGMLYMAAMHAGVT